MYEDAHLEMLYEDRQGQYDEGPDDFDGPFDMDEDDEITLDRPDPIDQADEASGDFTPGWEY